MCVRVCTGNRYVCVCVCVWIDGTPVVGVSIADMLEGLEEEDLAHMPPFPFPKELFPPGTFPEAGVVYKLNSVVTHGF